jgi:muramoyltetrapeptide carboxypeptidase LdcA involved in peptidoglycan recycling
MDARFSALPYSAQAAVRDASKRLDAAQRFLTSKKKIAARAERAGEAAKERAARLQDMMREVKPLPLRLRRPSGGYGR